MTSMIMRRFVPAALFVMGVALLGATPALAAAGGSVVLKPAGVEPGASGRATLSKVHRPYPQNPLQLKGLLVVQCKGLMPNATYTVYGTHMLGVASEAGTLSLSGAIYFSGSRIPVLVYSAQGRVLTGTIQVNFK